MSSPVNGKSPKANKSNKIGKEKPNLEFTCKFRGKYDLSKNKKNNEISLENAVNLFEVIHKKNEKLFKSSNIKMYQEKKTFSFADQKSFSKIHHRVPYMQVKKFFVLHKDPTMVIMGVHHKTHRWFLVFQFSSTDDLKKFCDEIEGQKKKAADNEEPIETPIIDEMDSNLMVVPEILIDGESRGASPTLDEINNNDIERLSIHSEMYNAHLKADDNDNFDDSYYEPDMEPENAVSDSSFIEEVSPIMQISRFSSRTSSRNSIDSDFDENVHCDNYSQAKLKDLLMKSDHLIYNDITEWDEELKCMEYPKEFDETHFNKIGPVYIYSARYKISSPHHNADQYSVSSDEEDQGMEKMKNGHGQTKCFTDYRNL